MTYEEAAAEGPVVIVGCDPGPDCSAVTVVLFQAKEGSRRAELLAARYFTNRELCGECPELPGDYPVFLAYESVGFQGKFCGDVTFETAAMGGEIRRLFRPRVRGTYAFRSSEWRHPLTGIGNAKTPQVYDEICRFFQPTGGGADPYKGNKESPGPLALLHAAGKGGKMEHMKDALGVALGLTQVRFRSGRDPETYRRPW